MQNNWIPAVQLQKMAGEFTTAYWIKWTKKWLRANLNPITKVLLLVVQTPIKIAFENLWFDVGSTQADTNKNVIYTRQTRLIRLHTINRSRKSLWKQLGLEIRKSTDNEDERKTVAISEYVCRHENPPNQIVSNFLQFLHFSFGLSKIRKRICLATEKNFTIFRVAPQDSCNANDSSMFSRISFGPRCSTILRLLHNVYCLYLCVRPA